MKKAVLMIGVGQMGGVFARGFLKKGCPVYPVNRDMNINDIASQIDDIEAIVVGVGEKDLHSVLDEIPDDLKDKLVLLQNELLPGDWESHGIKDPTVISVWFEKKKGQDYKVIIPSPVYGPKASLIKESLESIDVSIDVLETKEQLLFELVLKNLYILTVNIAGLKVGGTVGQLWNEHNELARKVAEDVLDIQFKLAGREMDKERLIEGMLKAFNGDLDHKCMGRSAPDRLKRALSIADKEGLDVPTLHEISACSKS